MSQTKPILAAAVTTLLIALTPNANAQQTVALTPLRERLRTVEVIINGQRGEFLFDSAAGLSIVSPTFAERIGCTPRGRTVGFRMFGDRVDMARCDDVSLGLGSYRSTALNAGVLDITPYLQEGQMPQDGMLGLDAFDGRVVTLDVGHNALIVETPESFAARIAGAAEVPARIAREAQGGALAVNIGLPTPNTGTAWFELDSGNGGTVLVSKHLASEFGLDPDAQGPQTATLQLAPGISVTTDRVFTPSMILDGNLGMPFLSRHIVTVDLAAGRVWIKPNA